MPYYYHRQHHSDTDQVMTSSSFQNSSANQMSPFLTTSHTHSSHKTTFPLTSNFVKQKSAIKRKIILTAYFGLTSLLVLLLVSFVVAQKCGYAHLQSAPHKITHSDKSVNYNLERNRRSHHNDIEQDNSNSSLLPVPVLHDTNVTFMEDCIPPSVDEFPPGVLSESQRHNGGFILNVIVALYMFLALAVVCDDFFVPSLEILCDKLQMSEDVAGATFMSAGSSAPEFFTSLIGVFVAKGDVGVSTIVGSAVFNILCIIGICALFAGHVIKLTWWPLLRDSCYYLFSVVLLIIVAYDEQIEWYESVMLVVPYVLYIVLMAFNRYIQDAINTHSYSQTCHTKTVSKSGGTSNDENISTYSDNIVRGIALQTPSSISDVNSNISVHKNTAHMISHNDKEILEPKDFADASLRIMLTKNFKPACRMRAAARIIIAAIKREAQITVVTEGNLDKYKTSKASPTCADRGVGVIGGGTGPQITQNNYQIDIEHIEFKSDSEATFATSNHLAPNSSEEDDFSEGSLCAIPHSPVGLLKWLILLPMNLVFFVTLPDCRVEKWRRFYIVTFVNSILWISAISYVMVWMATVFGDSLGVPDTVMGATFLAAGTSIPDCIASLLVARQGLGDMAVSNSIGSNVFDILVGLGVPWFLKTIVISWGYIVHIRSKGLKFSVILLFISVAVTLVTIAINKWKLNRKLGVFFLVVYMGYIIMACLIELNVFAEVNPPRC